MGVDKVNAATAAVVAVALWGGLQLHSMVSLPPHLLHHPVMYKEGFISNASGVALRRMVHEMGMAEQGFPLNTQDTRFYKTRFEHIGEARPIGPDGACAHEFLVPSQDKTQCILPGRIDIGRHFILRGGVEGLKEDYESLVNRLLSFGAFIFNPADYPPIQELFGDPNFLAAAEATCPPHKPHLDPFQFNIIQQVPGQSVALHVDGVYFWGATRFEFPQWLLAVMKFSGLWEDQFVDQVQVVAYLHEWTDTTGERAGKFVYWDENTRAPKSVDPVPLAASSVDGSKTVHAATIYYPGRKAPLLDKSKDTFLRYRQADDRWTLDVEGRDMYNYTWDELRVSLVYRARCFKDAAEAKAFKRRLKHPEEAMELDEVLGRLAADMVSRGKLTSVAQGLGMDRLQFALLLMDTYIKYPGPPSAAVPVNYCALPRIAPWTKGLLEATVCRK